jgi:hypothetical protein
VRHARSHRAKRHELIGLLQPRLDGAHLVQVLEGDRHAHHVTRRSCAGDLLQVRRGDPDSYGPPVRREDFHVVERHRLMPRDRRFDRRQQRATARSRRKHVAEAPANQILLAIPERCFRRRARADDAPFRIERDHRTGHALEVVTL